MSGKEVSVSKWTEMVLVMVEKHQTRTAAVLEHFDGV
jgi:hypothetical protein